MLRCIESQPIPTASSSSNSRAAVILVKQDIEGMPLPTSRKSPEAVIVDWKVSTHSGSFGEYNMSIDINLELSCTLDTSLLEYC